MAVIRGRHGSYASVTSSHHCCLFVCSTINRLSIATNSYNNYSLLHLNTMAVNSRKGVTRELETSISRLGENEQVPVHVPRYATYHANIVATWKEGRAPGELCGPFGVAIHEETHLIFVVSWYNNRIEIFSETGEFFHQLGV